MIRQRLYGQETGVTLEVREMGDKSYKVCKEYENKRRIGRVQNIKF